MEARTREYLMRALILIAGLALAVTACHADAPYQDEGNVDDNNAVAYHRCPNGDVIPVDQVCPKPDVNPA
jgi:hypothetical protein